MGHLLSRLADGASQRLVLFSTVCERLCEFFLLLSHNTQNLSEPVPFLLALSIVGGDPIYFFLESPRPGFVLRSEISQRVHGFDRLRTLETLETLRDARQ